MRSIGRTQNTSSLFLTLGVACTLATAGSAFHFASNTLKKLQTNGDIEVSLTGISNLANLRVSFAESTGTERALAEQAILLHAEESRAIAHVSPKLNVTAWKAPRKVLRFNLHDVSATPNLAQAKDKTSTIDATGMKLAFTAKDQDTVSLVQASAIRNASVPADDDAGSEMMASPEELLSMQRLHIKTQKQFHVAIHNLELFVEEQKRIAAAHSKPQPDEVPSDAEYTDIMDLYLQQADASAAVIIEDEIDTSMASASRVVETAPAPKAAQPVRVVKPETSGKALTKTATQSPVQASTKAEVTAQQSSTKKVTPLIRTDLPAPPKPLNTQTQQPGLPDAGARIAAPAVGLHTAGLDPIPETPILKTTLDAKVSTQKAETPAARLVAPVETLTTQLNSQSKTAQANENAWDDPTADENDYSFVDDSSSSVKAPVATYRVEMNQGNMGKAPKNPTTSTSPKTAPAPQMKPQSTSVTVAKSSATEPRKKKQINGVFQDPNGISIQWNMSSSTRPLESTVSLRDTHLPKLPDPKKFCDSALIGITTFTNLTPDPISVCRRPFSHEGPADGAQAKWWEVRESTEHWPTLIYQKEKEAFSRNRHVPMLSIHAAKALAILNKSKLQENAGIILGELNAGQDIAMIGRADPVMLFDASYQLVETRDTARFFAFMNVAPGNPLLSVTFRGSSRGGSIPIVVKPGFVTYVRVPDLQTRNLFVRILDSSSAQTPKPIAGLTLRVIGQNGKSGVTNSKGEVTLNEVLVFGDYPIYVDVAPNEKSFKHRYRLNGDQMKNRDLFYFTDRTVGNWITQLDGGISPLSGMIVGAFGRIPMNASEAFIRLQTQDTKSALSPEIYMLGTEDHLITHPKADANLRRFMGVQIPEGTQIPTAIRADGTVLWSELIVSQPGVINVVSP